MIYDKNVEYITQFIVLSYTRYGSSGSRYIDSILKQHIEFNVINNKKGLI
ncbi:hypothetical protein RCIP0023_00297 [Klebsiella phage RCIP0023]